MNNLYLAFDGKQFDLETDCIDYEASKNIAVIDNTFKKEFDSNKVYYAHIQNEYYPIVRVKFISYEEVENEDVYQIEGVYTTVKEIKSRYKFITIDFDKNEIIVTSDKECLPEEDISRMFNFDIKSVVHQ